MHWWQNLRTLWPGALRQQVTRTGLAYSGAIVVVALAAVLSANNLLFLILAAMLSILAVSGFVSKLTLAGLEIDLLLPPHISARRKFRAIVRVKNLKRWMPSFSIHVTGATDGKHPSGYEGALFFPAIPGGVALEEAIDLRFPARGRYSERTFQLTTRFPFGFAERRERVTLRHEVIVYPCLEPRPDSKPSPTPSPENSKPGAAAPATISTASAPTKPSKAPATWIGKPPPTPAPCKSASSPATKIR